MTDLEFSFEEPLWATQLRRIPPNGNISATHFLTLLEDENDEAVEEALLYLESNRIRLCTDDLPKATAAPQAAVRLRREEELVKAGTLRQTLEENDPLRLYLQEVEQLPKAADVSAAARRFADGCDRVLPALTNAMLPTVIDMACDYVGRGVLLMDLIQEGSLGLWQGILCYTEGDFQQHIRRWIDQYLAKAVVLQARAEGVGRKMKQAMADYRNADEWLLSELGRNPTLSEIAAYIHLTEEETRAAADMLQAARLLQQAIPSGPEADDTAAEEEQAVEDTAYFQMRGRVAEMLGTLDAQQAKILTLRFALDGGLPLTAEQVGEKLHLTAEQVAELENAALIKLRNEG